MIRTVNDIRSHRYSMLRQYFRAADAEHLDDSSRLSRGVAQRHSAAARLGGGPQHRGAGRARLAGDGQRGAARRHRRTRPGPDTVFKEGDVVVVYGTPEAVEHAETLLLMG